MKTFKKISLFTSVVFSVSLLSGCAMETRIETNVTLCRRYYLMRDITFVDNDDLYDDIPSADRYNISSIYLNGISNEEVSHIDFHYNGYFEFLLTRIDDTEVYFGPNTYTVTGNSEDAVVSLNFGETTKICKASFIKKSNQDVIITHLRVPYKIVIEGIEKDAFLWFFNGVFGGCPFEGEI